MIMGTLCECLDTLRIIEIYTVNQLNVLTINFIHYLSYSNP